MAGDWIKMRSDLGDDPSVVAISEAVGLDEDAIVGKLHRLWSWADKHTTNGMAPAITARWVDKYVGATGFADAMVAAGWLEFTPAGVVFPSFEKHNGQSAKTRAEATTRKRLSRENRDKGETGDERTVIPRPFVRHVMRRDAYKCVFCGLQSDEKTEGSKFAKLSVDHLVPCSRGGGNAVENLACACKPCNNEKNDRTPEEWGLLPTFIQDGVVYSSAAGMSQKSCDTNATREEKRRSKDKPPIPPKGGDGPVSLKTWAEARKAAGEVLIPEDDPVFAYAATVGIPDEFMAVAWAEFKARYTQPDAKRYRNWRAVFRKAVRGNWLRLWFLDGEGYKLTTTGLQAQRAKEAVPA